MNEIHTQAGTIAAPLTTLGESIATETQQSLRAMAKPQGVLRGWVQFLKTTVYDRPFQSVTGAFIIGIFFGAYRRG